MGEKVNKYIGELKSLFINAKDKHEANYKSIQLMAEMSGDAGFFSEALENYISQKGHLNKLHYPIIGMYIEANEHFTLVANCWIPLPDRATDISTKAIHHHGDMLLTTATAFGSGYEHWTFETPSVVDYDKEIYELKFLKQESHPLNHVTFVDHHIAHLPLYPPDITITYALWSNRFRTTWKDKLKRQPIVANNVDLLRGIVNKVGLSKQLDAKNVEYFDFYPTCEGFRGQKDRDEYERGSNEEFLTSLFQIVQETGNEHLAPVIRKKLDSAEKIDNRAFIKELLEDLGSGKPICGELSPIHYGIKCVNFTRDEILDALTVQNGKPVEF